MQMKLNYTATALAGKDKAVRITKTAVGGSSVAIHFNLRCLQIRPWEFVFLVGSNYKLGNWLPEKAVEMVKDADNNQLWKTCIQLTAHECRDMLNFRYFIGYYLQNGPEAKKQLLVANWESSSTSRCVLPSVEAIKGVCRAEHVDEYGTYRGRRGVATDGWLNQQDQKQILFRIHGEALTFFKPKPRSSHKAAYHIKVTPFDLRHKEVGSEDPDDNQDSIPLPLLPSFSQTDVANLNSHDPHFHDQHLSGELFHNQEDYFVFRTKSLAVEHLAFRVELFSRAGGSRSPSRNCPPPISNGLAPPIQPSIPTNPKVLERFAIAYCMPSSFQDTTFGEISLPLIAKNQQPVGQIKIDYLLVTCLPSSISSLQTMQASYCKHWKKRRTLEVGHRGCGNSYTKFSAVRENTIHSLNQAARLGADFVEFDTQLSQDKVAIVFHDFHVLVSVAKRSPSQLDIAPNGGNGHCSTPTTPDNQPNGNKTRLLVSNAEPSQITDFHQLAVSDLRLEQLRLLQVHHHQALDNQDKLQLSGGPDESFEHMPFPKLVDVLQLVNPDTGFNIEVKYPQGMQDGTHECKNFFERNEFVDIILLDVLQHGGNRRILFSSFDPDICTLISVKQNKYPVLFLNIGVTTRYVPYVDVRTQSSQMAVNFAACSQILGVNFHSEDILRDPWPVTSAKQFGLVSFVWGDDLEKAETIEYFRSEILVDGIIYDRIGEIEHRKNVFVVEREVRNALFNKPSLSPSPSRTNSVDKLSVVTLNGVGSAPVIKLKS